MIGKISIIPSKHYLLDHSDVEWGLVINTIISPSKTMLNKRYGKQRITYIKNFKSFKIKIHAEKTINNEIIVINAFKN